MVTHVMTARRLFALAALVVVVGTGAEARAQDAAAAEALFDEGKQLAAESRWAEACPKFAASQAADPSVGTLLNWADCLEKEGKIGSALLRFREAEEQLKAASDARATIAGERRAGLEPRAPRILIRSTTPPPTGVQLALDGERVPLEGVAAAGVERIVDPGPHSVEIRRGDVVLEKRDGEAREGVAFELALDLAAIERAHPAVKPPEEKRTPKDPPSRATFALGWTLAATGGAALLVGGTLGLVALGAAGQAEEVGHCVDQVCSPVGVDDVQTAGDLAEAGQWIGLAGVALVAVGVTLVLTAPSADEPAAARPVRLMASPGRLLVDGSF
jgi:hypothetical protein